MVILHEVEIDNWPSIWWEPKSCCTVYGDNKTPHKNELQRGATQTLLLLCGFQVVQSKSSLQPIGSIRREFDYSLLRFASWPNRANFQTGPQQSELVFKWNISKLAIQAMFDRSRNIGGTLHHPREVKWCGFVSDLVCAYQEFRKGLVWRYALWLLLRARSL